jgi:ATP-dependent DNA helicase RecG
LIFFHARGDYLERILPLGEERLISGKLEVFDHRAQMIHPEYILRPEAQDELPQFEPVYPLTAGVSGKLMGKAVRAAVDKLPDLLEWIEPSVLRDNGWPNFTTAVRQCHAPKGAADVAAHSPAS